MASSDSGRRAAELEAHQALWNLWRISRHAARNVDNWEAACALLQTHYTVAHARQDSDACAMRIRYLEISEPPPRLADFVPVPSYDRIADAPRQLALARYTYLMARQRHPERERQRLKELETTKALYRALKDAEARAEAVELARRREWQQSRWPKSVVLEGDVYNLDGVAAQVECQNAKIESRVKALSGLLDVGLENISGVPVPDLTDPASVATRVESALTAMTLPCGIEPKATATYSVESRQLAVEYELPTIGVIPMAESYRYVDSDDTVVENLRAPLQVKDLYSTTIAQLALLSLAVILAADNERRIEAVVFNGYVDAVDPARGQPIRPCLISARVTHDAFAGIGLGQVDPSACLERLSATVSQNPAELVPVQPLGE
jgi:hypothetical protein